nr:hypothetical protein [Pseudonocardia nigra]
MSEGGDARVAAGGGDVGEITGVAFHPGAGALLPGEGRDDGVEQYEGLELRAIGGGVAVQDGQRVFERVDRTGAHRGPAALQIAQPGMPAVHVPDPQAHLDEVVQPATGRGGVRERCTRSR